MIHDAVILSTGDELTTGKVVDTNSAVIADQLFSLGVKVAAVLKVGDDPNRLLWAFARASELGDLIIAEKSSLDTFNAALVCLVVCRSVALYLR